MTETRPQAGDELVVVFALAGESYGVAIGAVQEIIRPPLLTAVPHAPAAVEGVINLRGRIIPVVSLRRRFGLPPAASDRAARIIVFASAGQTVGVSADGVSEVARIPADAIEPVGLALAGTASHHLRGIATVGSRLIILLDLDELVGAAARAA